MVLTLLAVASLSASAWPGFVRAQFEDPNANTQIMMNQTGRNGSVGSERAESDRVDAGQQYQMGLAALQAGKVHEAERDFEHAVAGDPHNAEALTMRGVARQRGGDLGGAARDFEKSLKMDPTQLVALREYGVTLAMQGKADKAKAQLGLLKLQAEGCGEACPDAAKLKDAVKAVQDALAQPSAHS
jgi:Flp pilus assembly protein TadD